MMRRGRHGTEIESESGRGEEEDDGRKEYSADPNERDDGTKSDEPGLGCSSSNNEKRVHLLFLSQRVEADA